MTARGIETRGSRRGFTILEMATVAVLMSLMVVILADCWRAFVRPALYAQDLCRIAVEARLARETLARDFSGSLPEYTPEPDGPPTGPNDYPGISRMSVDLVVRDLARLS